VIDLVDRLTPERRSWLMSRVGGKNTTPELKVRKAAHAGGFRFRLHRKDLPGKPDLVFPKHEFALFVHGCFWHRHPGCSKASAPSSDFWRTKFETNVARDARITKELKKSGWRVGVIWECQTKDPTLLAKKIEKLIAPKRKRKTART
jgi:DNA mismatch endonuclease, patch repair protein